MAPARLLATIWLRTKSVEEEGERKTPAGGGGPSNMLAYLEGQ